MQVQSVHANPPLASLIIHKVFTIHHVVTMPAVTKIRMRKCTRCAVNIVPPVAQIWHGMNPPFDPPLTIYRIIAWAIKWSAQRRLHGQTNVRGLKGTLTRLPN